jgi:XTP/dITP diphosphohydrolase
MTHKLVIATHNIGKAMEIRDLLGKIPFVLMSLDDFPDVRVSEEPADSYEGNAIAKARNYAVATSEVVLADDSGLEVAALAGAPGVLSARYGGPNASDEDRRRKLLHALDTTDSDDRSARFVCAVALAKPNGDVIKVTQGVCEGSICEEARGNLGFGYDPIFIPNGYAQTFGELSESVKNRISHRAKALLSMREFLVARNWPT